MRRIDAADDGNLQDWLSGNWPALFRNKPDAVLHELVTFAEDRTRGWYMRMDAIDTIIACARTAGGQRVDEVLAWAAGIAFDDAEDFDVRSLTGNKLLDYARPEHLLGLEALADLQPDLGAIFRRKDIEAAYAAGPLEATPSSRFDDPWRFYAPAAIEARQRRWAEEDAVLDEDLLDEFPDEPGETYVRPGPKIGRNDPCPCGSGKKYKKCCLVS